VNDVDQLLELSIIQPCGEAELGKAAVPAGNGCFGQVWRVMLKGHKKLFRYLEKEFDQVY
jgi:hypothetical protein